jgi:hypothetical protein
MPWHQARAQLVQHGGTQWDARVVGALLDLIDEDQRRIEVALDRGARAS